MTIQNTALTFTDRETYVEWRSEWRAEYKALSLEIRQKKVAFKELQRSESNGIYKASTELRSLRHKAHEMMKLREAATARRDRILGMHAQLKEQFARFPLDLGQCKNVDFHFNKINVEFSFMPMWALKAKGQTFYVHNIESAAAWNTQERTGSTRGVLRFKKCNITIDAMGTAKISEAVDFSVDEMAEAA